MDRRVWIGRSLAQPRFSMLVLTLLFGVTASDPVTFVAVALLLLTVAIAIAAALLPAWRAARLDPLVALRGD